MELQIIVKQMLKVMKCKKTKSVDILDEQDHD